MEDESPHDLSTFFIILRSCFLALYGLWIMSGNVFCIAVTRRMPNLADSTKVLMTTLAVSDFSVGCYHIILVVPSAMNAWPYGQAMCAIFTGLSNTIVMMSLLSIIFVNVERYIAVTRPYKFPVWCTRRRTIAVVISAAILAIFTSLSVQIAGLRSEYIPVVSFCFYKSSSGTVGVIALIVMVIVPMVITTFAHHRMTKTSREHEQRDNQRGQNEANKLQVNKALKTFLVVSLAFFTCYAPYFLHETVKAYTGTESPDWLQFVTLWLTSINSALNVFVYFIFNRNYRQIAKKILLERFPCCKITAVGPVDV